MKTSHLSVLIALVVAATRPALVGAGSLVKEKGEFRVNVDTAGSVGTCDVAARTDGGFVVVWQKRNSVVEPQGPAPELLARIYDANGEPSTGELRVNSEVASQQFSPRVVVQRDDGFVVAWARFNPPGDAFIRRFAASGVPVSAEIRINDAIGDFRLDGFPALAPAANGRFAAVWESNNFSEDRIGIYGRHFDEKAHPKGTEFRISSPPKVRGFYPDVAVRSDGSMVVAWSSFECPTPQPPCAGTRLFGQIVSASSAPLGDKFQIAADDAADPWWPAVGIAPDGGFVVAWQDMRRDDPLKKGVFARRFDPNGLDASPEFRVSDHASGEEPAIAFDQGGGFLIAWRDFGDGGGEVYARYYRASDGASEPGVLLVNTYTTYDQWQPEVAYDNHGGFIVVWQSDDQDGDRGGIFGQRLRAPSER